MISGPTTFVSSVFSCYLTVMGLPRDLIRTIGHLKTTSALAPLSMPAGLIGVFAVLMTIVGDEERLTADIIELSLEPSPHKALFCLA